MASKTAADRLRTDIIRITGLGLDSRSVRSRVLERLRRVLPVDAVFFATCEPSTLLFTDVMADDVLLRLTSLFLRNEFLEDDVNKFRAIARSPFPVRTLDQATSGRRAESARYRNILQPSSLGDEMRVALRSADLCWGFMCLHREAGTGFTANEVAFMGSVARPIAEGLRGALLAARLTDLEAPQPGVLLLDERLEVTASTSAADALLEELTGTAGSSEPPLPVRTVAARLLARDLGHEGPPPMIRMLSRSNRWLVLHATHLAESMGEEKIAVIIEPARPDDFIPLMLRAHRLSPRETEVAGLVLAGHSTRDICEKLALSMNSVQDYLKVVFEKVGVHSRRELTAYLQGQSRKAQPTVRRGSAPVES